MAKSSTNWVTDPLKWKLTGKIKGYAKTKWKDDIVAVETTNVKTF